MWADALSSDQQRETEDAHVSSEVVFEDVAPVVPVRNLTAALERYRRLGFAVRAYGHGTGYGYADRDAVSLHLRTPPLSGVREGKWGRLLRPA